MSRPAIGKEPHRSLVAAEVQVTPARDGVELVRVPEQAPANGRPFQAEGLAVDRCKVEDLFAAGHGSPDGASQTLSVEIPRLSTALLPLSGFSLTGYPTGMELHDILARIEHRLKVVGLSESAASKQAGKPDAVRNLRRALEKDERQGVSTATLHALAPVLQTTAVWLFAGAGPEDIQEAEKSGSPDLVMSDGNKAVWMIEAKKINSKMTSVGYAGIVEAGSFREVSDFDDIEHEPIAFPADPDYPWATQLQFEVRGDSMNALMPRPILNGDRLIALDFEGLGGRVALHTGLIVVVQQSKDGGLLVERSVKQLEVYEDRYEFHPRSTNKRYKPIVIPHDMAADDGKEVRILALVRSVMNRL